MVDVRAVAIRFADLWAVDHHRMVDEIYAAGIQMEGMALPGKGVDGNADLHALEDELARRIPEHRHELVRVIVDGTAAFLETTVVGPTTGEYSQAGVWWDLDENDQVHAEIGWFDWAHRTGDTRRSHGTVPPDDRRRRGPSAWYGALVDDLVEQWLADPVGVVAARCAPDVTADLIGRTSVSGLDAVSRAAEQVRALVPSPELRVLRVVGEGGVIAVLLRLRSGVRSTRGTVVLTLDAQDRIVGIRLYVDWSKAVEDGPS